MISLPRSIDLNSDVAESLDPAQMEREHRLLDSVTSINIACGVHAGSPDLMRRMVRLAHLRSIEIGAHPGLKDQTGGGRHTCAVSPDEAERLVADQVRTLAAICIGEGARLAHVKPHGALYNMAATNRTLADAIARAVRAVEERLILVGLAGSQLIAAGKAHGLRVAEEAFADRAYQSDHTLVPRGEPGAVIEDELTVVARALGLVRDGIVPSITGDFLPIHADTLCLHGNTPGADRLACAVRQALTGAGIAMIRMDHASC